MKFKTSTLALSATLAAGLASSAFADVTPYEKLVFETNQTYSVAAGGAATRGSWKEGSTAVTPVVENSKVVIDSDADLPLSFVPATDDSEFDVTELKFNVEASYVPATVELAKIENARCGFAIKYDSATPRYYLFGVVNDKKDWVQVSDKEVIPASGNMFDLTVRLDYRTGVNKATYFVGTTEIGTTEIGSISLGDKSAVGAIDFIGNGSLSTLNGYKLKLISEKIEIVPGGGTGSSVTIVIPEAAIEAIKNKAGSIDKVADYLNESVTVGEGMTRLDAQVLFGTTEPTSANKTVVKGVPTKATSGKVRVNIEGLSKDAIGGATIKYQLEGSKTGAENTWNNIGNAETDVTKLEFDQNTEYRFIRVKTTVEYGNK